MSGQLVWLITGCSSGIGRDLTIEALSRGDKVIATARARSIRRLDDLKQQGADVLELDVTVPLETLHAIAKTAIALHGRIDVVVNNAAYVAIGTLEEHTPEEDFAQFNANVFGALNVARAFLPYMRARKAGTILWVGSIGGWIPVVNAGIYAASKAVVRSFAETMHAEISPLGLRSMVLEPGYFRTPVLSSTQRAPYISRIEDYRPITGPVEQQVLAGDGTQRGDPAKLVKITADFVRGEGTAKEGLAAGKKFPLLLHVGADTVPAVRSVCTETLRRLDEWEDVFASTDFSSDISVGDGIRTASIQKN